MWRTDDRGASWKKPARGRPGPGKLQSVSLDPRDPKRLYAGAEPVDLFISNDEGKSWDNLASVREHPVVPTVDYPVASVEPHIRDVSVDPTVPDTMYLALQG